MNRRAERSIVGSSTVDSASCQVVMRDSGNSSIRCREVLGFGVSISLLKRSKRGDIREFGGRNSAENRFVIPRQARLTGRGSQSRGLCLGTRNFDVCSVHAWRFRISKRALPRFSRDTKYRGLCMLLTRSW